MHRPRDTLDGRAPGSVTQATGGAHHAVAVVAVTQQAAPEEGSFVCAHLADLGAAVLGSPVRALCIADADLSPS